MCCVYINQLQCIFLPLICWKSPWNHGNFYQSQHPEISQLNHSLWRNVFLFLTWHLLNFIFTVYKNWEVDSKKIFLYLLSPLVILELTITLPATSDRPVISTFLEVTLTDRLIQFLWNGFRVTFTVFSAVSDLFSMQLKCFWVRRPEAVYNMQNTWTYTVVAWSVLFQHVISFLGWY